MTPPAEWRLLATELPPGRTATFQLACGGRRLDGFVVNHEGTYHAWRNRCPHVGTPLDVWPNEFLSDDGRWLVCGTHGAIFEPDSGRCADGPCAGDGLTRLPVRCVDAVIVVSCPDP